MSGTDTIFEEEEIIGEPVLEVESTPFESFEFSETTVSSELSSEDTEQAVVVIEVPDLELCTEAITVLEKDDNDEDVLGKITTSTIEVEDENTVTEHSIQTLLR